MGSDRLSREEVERRLAGPRWECRKVKDYSRHSLWRSEHGYYFTVAHECTEAEFRAVIEDLIKNRRKRNV